MPPGQTCGHCKQPEHNIRTCEGYRKYVEVENELAATREELARVAGENAEDKAIIRAQQQRIDGQADELADANQVVEGLRGRIRELVSERNFLRARLGAMADHSVGTVKGTSAGPNW